jgi:hypothetical protein
LIHFIIIINQRLLQPTKPAKVASLKRKNNYLSAVVLASANTRQPVLDLPFPSGDHRGVVDHSAPNGVIILKSNKNS